MQWIFLCFVAVVRFCRTSSSCSDTRTSCQRMKTKSARCSSISRTSARNYSSHRSLHWHGIISVCEYSSHRYCTDTASYLWTFLHQHQQHFGLCCCETLVWLQKGHPTCESWVLIGWWWQFDGNFALFRNPVCTTMTPEWFDVLIPAYYYYCY